MALFSEASGGGEPSGSEVPGSGCLRFGVRSYLHQFYEEREPEDRGSVHRRWRSKIIVWKVYLALGLLILTAGVAILSVGYSTPRRIESFGEGDMFFVDASAASFNRGLHLSAAAGTGLSCLGAALTAATGIGVLFLAGKGSKRWKQTGFRDAVAKPTGREQGKVPATHFAEVEPVKSAN